MRSMLGGRFHNLEVLILLRRGTSLEVKYICLSEQTGKATKYQQKRAF